MRKALLLLAIGVIIPGCFGTDAPTEDTTTANTASNVTIDETRPAPTFGGNITVGTSVGPDLNATLEAPPRLVVGEWWKIRLESPLDGTTSEFYRVVADVEGDTYIFGMPHEGWWKEAVVYHTPAFGEVNANDLSYHTHNNLFTPLQFPLTDGDTWETTFSGGQTMNANVAITSPTEATITFTTPSCGPIGLLAAIGECNGQNTALEIIYDATIHEVREFRHPTVIFSVIDHGYDYEGWVTIPRAENLVFFHGRIGPTLGLDLQPAAPVETVEIAGGYNRMSFIQVVQAIGPGAYSEVATDPHGNEYRTEKLPATQGLTIQFFEATNPDGTWNLQHLAAGPGVVFIEGIAYHQYDIHLPTGNIRSDHSHDVIR